MNHTPTPYEVKHIGQNVYIEPATRKGFIADLQYTDCQSEEEMREALANAQFIVRACNAHEELVTTLKSCLSWLSSYPGGGAMAQYDKVRKILTTIEKGA